VKGIAVSEPGMIAYPQPLFPSSMMSIPKAETTLGPAVEFDPLVLQGLP